MVNQSGFGIRVPNTRKPKLRIRVVNRKQGWIAHQGSRISFVESTASVPHGRPMIFGVDIDYDIKRDLITFPSGTVYGLKPIFEEIKTIPRS